MRLIERLFVLKQISPFDLLDYSQLAAVAEVVRARRYRPGEILVSEGRIMQRLFVLVRGQAEQAGTLLPPLFDIRSILLEEPVALPILADAEKGATCFLLTKAHFYRVMNEFPEFTVGLLPGTAAAAAGTREAP